MDRLYKKSELDFALVCIAAYVVLFSLADSLSASVGVPKLVTAPMGILLVLLVLGFLQKHGLWQRYGLCAFRGDARMSLCFLPLLLIASVNLWNGIALRASPAETVLFLLSMACAGFLEEVIFRGFLFRALCRDNVKLAVLVSSVTFGLGHIVNLLNGQDLIPTLLQICYATAVGFLFTVLFYKGKSLLPSPPMPPRTAWAFWPWTLPRRCARGSPPRCSASFRLPMRCGSPRRRKGRELGFFRKGRATDAMGKIFSIQKIREGAKWLTKS